MPAQPLTILPSHVTIAPSCTRCHGFLFFGLMVLSAAKAPPNAKLCALNERLGRLSDHRATAQELHKTGEPIGYVAK